MKQDDQILKMNYKLEHLKEFEAKEDEFHSHKHDENLQLNLSSMLLLSNESPLQRVESRRVETIKLPAQEIQVLANKSFVPAKKEIPPPKILVCKEAQTLKIVPPKGITSINKTPIIMERKAPKKILAEKFTLTDPIPIQERIVEVEVIKEVIKEVVKEHTMQPVERVSKSTNTDIKPLPKISIADLIQLQREQPTVPVKELIARATQTVAPQATLPKLNLENPIYTMKITPSPSPKVKQEITPLSQSNKLFTFHYDGATPSPVGSNEAVDEKLKKMETRLKFYEDQNIKLASERDIIKKKAEDLYSKLSGKQFESNSSFNQQLEVVKAENEKLRKVLMKERNDFATHKLEVEKAKENEFKTFRTKENEVMGEVLALTIENEKIKKKVDELLKLQKPKVATHEVGTETVHTIDIPVSIFEKKTPNQSFEMADLHSFIATPKINSDKRDKISKHS